MANEFQHKDPGGELTQAEFITTDGTGHIVESQATGDILYASSSTVLKGLAKGSDGTVLELASGVPAWTASPTIGSTSWANANHAHAASNSGGTLTTLGTVATGVWQGTAIATTYIAADAITGAKIADDAIDSEHYTDGSIDAAHLAADAVTGAKIADDAIDSEHYTDGSIDNAHLADDAVDSDELAAGAVDTAHIGDNQVTAAKIFDLARGSVLVGNASAATAELTIGSNTYVLASDGTDIAWTAASTGAVTREGGQTTEATSTSTSVADLITAASLTIAAVEPFTLYGIGRKTAGHASGAGFSLKLNSTSVAVPTASPGSTYSANVLGGHSASLRAEGTSAYLNVQATVTNHVFGGGFGLFVFNVASGGQGALTSTCTENDPRPTAEVTDVIGTVIVGNSGNTAGYDELQVYSNAAS